MFCISFLGFVVSQFCVVRVVLFQFFPIFFCFVSLWFCFAFLISQFCVLSGCIVPFYFSYLLLFCVSLVLFCNFNFSVLCSQGCIVSFLSLFSFVLCLFGHFFTFLIFQFCVLRVVLCSFFPLVSFVLCLFSFVLHFYFVFQGYVSFSFFIAERSLRVCSRDISIFFLYCSQELQGYPIVVCGCFCLGYLLLFQGESICVPFFFQVFCAFPVQG